MIVPKHFETRIFVKRINVSKTCKRFFLVLNLQNKKLIVHILNVVFKQIVLQKRTKRSKYFQYFLSKEKYE